MGLAGGQSVNDGLVGRKRLYPSKCEGSAIAAMGHRFDL